MRDFETGVGPRDVRCATGTQVDRADPRARGSTKKKELFLNLQCTITAARRRGIAVLCITVALLTTGCVDDPSACSAQLLQSLGDGLGSAISALFEAAVLSALI